MDIEGQKRGSKRRTGTTREKGRKEEERKKKEDGDEDELIEKEKGMDCVCTNLHPYLEVKRINYSTHGETRPYKHTYRMSGTSR